MKKRANFNTMREAIIGLLLKWGCMHKWKLYYKFQLREKEDESLIESRHTLICDKCGKIKKIKL